VGCFDDSVRPPLDDHDPVSDARATAAVNILAISATAKR
jgi:hypothetical protein